MDGNWMRRWNDSRFVPGALLLIMAMALLPRSMRAQALLVGGRGAKPEIAVTSLTVTASPSLVSFQLHSKGTATGSSPISITTKYGVSVCLATCNINLYAYFGSAAAALSGGTPTVNIPSSDVLGQVPTGTPTAFTAFTQSGPVGGAGASLLLFSQSFLLSTLLAGNRTDSLSLEIDLSTLPQLPAATYSGTLYIQAQSF
jgi:hypothetical protein